MSADDQITIAARGARDARGAGGHFSAIDRFWAKVEGGSYEECWIWTACRENNGYGSFTPKTGQAVRAHRFAYEHMRGVIPDGLHLDHLCRNRACCNPWHLEPVTCAVNVRRGAIGAKTHCPSGHPLSGDNLYSHIDSRGYSRRFCRACRQINQLAYRERQRAA